MRKRDIRKKKAKAAVKKGKKMGVAATAPAPAPAKAATGLKTMICLILDRSGSMKGRETDVVGGVNAFITEQKQLPNPASIAFVRFDGMATERFREMGPLAECKPLKPADYQPRGETPLLDAVGRTIVQLDEDWKTEKPDRCIVMIVTDGEENASRQYTKEQIQGLIKARQNSGLWAFIYLGANVDAFAEATSMGINPANAANYKPTAKGLRATYMAAGAAVMSMRFSGSTVSDSLGGDIEEDGTVKRTPGRVATAVKAATAAWKPPTGTPTPAPASTDSGTWTPPV